MRRGWLAPLLTLLLAGPTRAADVRITFLPPPLEGTLSVGVYTLEGKLVRTLVQEANDDAFVAGLNGFIMSWDGKDDAGKFVPAGKYFVRGYAVGDLEVEGEAFHANDWFTDEDAPRVHELRSVRAEGRTLLLNAATLSGEAGTLKVELDSGKAVFTAGNAATGPVLEVPGRDGSTWKIEPAGEANEPSRVLVQRKGDDVLRELAIDPAEPQPFALAAATDRDELYLLERNATELRLRALRLKETKAAADGQPAVSEWEVFLTKSIHTQDTFAQVQDQLGRTPPPRAEEHLRVALMPNELVQGVAPAALSTVAGHDAKGSLLRTLDGLLLRRLTDTPALKWTVLSRGAGGAVTLFQSDGAVVEEYRVKKVEKMMAFDAGEYDWTGGQ